MLQRIRDSKWTKVFALGLVISILTEIINPLSLYAITGGPSQPEMAGFTPIDTDNMVDLFSGDFHYTIPIMTVPGPNGGFPINLNYTSGVGMEHEASWVGLGWNLNPGAINRQVRGVPDDFQNDIIEKVYHRRDNNTFLFSPGGGGEFYGGDFGIGLNQSKSFVYNTYKGISLCRRFGISALYVRDKDVQDTTCKLRLSANLNFSHDSDNGVTTSFSMNGGKNLKAGFNYGYNSKSGTYSYGNQISLSITESKKGKTKTTSYGGVGQSFSTAANLPSIRVPMSSNSWGVSFQAGGAGAYLEGYGTVKCNIVSQTTPLYEIEYPACGILYADKAGLHTLQDFNREKEICVDHDSRNLPLPVMTNDLFNITGELQGGTFRAYRSDYGHFYDNSITNSTTADDIGVDLAFGDGIQLGTNLSFTEGESTTGDWESGDYDQKLTFKDKAQYSSQTSQSIHKSLFEPFYFKMSGEQTAANIGLLSDIGFEKAVSFPIQRDFKPTFWGGIDYRYLLLSGKKNR